MKRRISLLLVVVAALSSLLLAMRHHEEGTAFKAGLFEPPRVAPDILLRGSDGTDVTLSRFRGKVVVLEFGFTHCETVCPVTLSKLSKVFQELGPASGDIQVIFVTVDPKRDTAARLHEYLQIFNPSFLGATGTSAALDAQAAELKRVRDVYGILAEEAGSDGGEYQIHHSASLLLIDRQGKLRALAPFGMPADAIAHDLRLMLTL